ncbi:hypothetical protein DFH07DRAFT_1064025 [Mycena maculata]|uniref:F-box domain-containing protein n=1 Tax=Mycena maculata TaxID=230809 RepID=A0AAD7IEC0_9AGAR|nr:hypothetical protein DFH07DRAFT_1064025 [Mycena maculata]
MHRALEILEVVEMICEQIIWAGRWSPSDSPRDLAVLARTCTVFCNPALNILWRHQGTIMNLLKCMPDDLWKIEVHSNGHIDIRLQRAIIQTDWERPRFYLFRVRSFSNIFENLRSTDFLETLSFCLPRECVFPNLEKLAWCSPSPASAPFPHVRLFLTPRIKNLVLGTIETISHLSILSNLVTKCPVLTTVTIWTNGFLDLEATPVISNFVCALTHVKSLDVPWLNPAAFTHLAQLPDVESLSFRRILHQPSRSLFPSPSTINFPSFRALQELKFISADLKIVGGLLTLASNCPLVRVEISNAGEPTKDTVGEFYVTVANHCSHAVLRRIYIGGDKKNQIAATAEQIDTYAVGLHELKPLFSFDNLVSVCLTHPVGFDLDDVAVLAMASAWPRIQDLVLVTSLTRHLDSRVTLEGLCAFAKYCPRLHTLEITFDATHIPENLYQGQTRVAQDSLMSLNVGSSAINEPRRVAKFLSAIFPKLQWITTLYEDLVEPVEEEEEVEEVIVVPAISASHGFWKEVDQAIYESLIPRDGLVSE